jgi:hypothetical protein
MQEICVVNHYKQSWFSSPSSIETYMMQFVRIQKMYNISGRWL